MTIEGFEDPDEYSNQESIFQEIRLEREHQDKKWGGSEHDNEHGAYDWAAFITYYLGKSVELFVNEVGQPQGKLLMFRYNMVKIAALAIAAIEAVDRKLNRG